MGPAEPEESTEHRTLKPQNMLTMHIQIFFFLCIVIVVMLWVMGATIQKRSCYMVIKDFNTLLFLYGKQLSKRLAVLSELSVGFVTVRNFVVMVFPVAAPGICSINQ